MQDQIGNGNIKSNSMSLSNNLACPLYHFSLFQSLSFLTHTFIPPIFSKPSLTIFFLQWSSPQWLFLIFVIISLYFGPPHSLFPPFFFLVAVAERSPPPPPLREGGGVGLPGEQEDSCEETSAARGRLGGWALHVIFTHLILNNLCYSSDKQCLKTSYFVKI